MKADITQKHKAAISRKSSCRKNVYYDNNSKWLNSHTFIRCVQKNESIVRVKSILEQSTDVPESCCRENYKSTWIMMVCEQKFFRGENEIFHTIKAAQHFMNERKVRVEED